MSSSFRSQISSALIRSGNLVFRNKFVLTLLTMSGARKLLRKPREWLMKGAKEASFEMDVYGIPIKMVDQSWTLLYYACFLSGEVYERTTSNEIVKLLRANPAATFVDMGSHQGFFSILAGNALGPNGKVVAFEPHPEYYQATLRNIELNQLDAVAKAYQVALSDNEGHASMDGSEERAFREVQEGTIDVVTFDQLCKREGIVPEIIKIDVHGAEGKILAGMPEVLKKHVTHLFCELHDHLSYEFQSGMMGYTVHDIIGMLKDAGLEVFELAKYDEGLGEVIPLAQDLFENPGNRMLYARR